MSQPKYPKRRKQPKPTNLPPYAQRAAKLEEISDKLRRVSYELDEFLEGAATTRLQEVRRGVSQQALNLDRARFIETIWSHPDVSDKLKAIRELFLTGDKNCARILQLVMGDTELSSEVRQVAQHYLEQLTKNRSNNAIASKQLPTDLDDPPAKTPTAAQPPAVEVNVFAGKYSLHQEESTMNNEGDTFITNQAGAVGPNAHAHNFTQYIHNDSANVDLSALAHELSLLRVELKRLAKEAEEDIAIGEIAAAETEARKGDRAQTFEHLKRAGSWALDAAKGIGTQVAAAAIKQSLGLP